jgi:hypothetical protein
MYLLYHQHTYLVLIVLYSYPQKKILLQASIDIITFSFSNFLNYIGLQYHS